MLDIRKVRRTLALLVVGLLAVVPVAWANEDLDQGLNYFKTGKYVEAAAAFQSLVDSSPSYDYGYFMLGLSFLQMGKTKEAEENLLKAIELNGDKFEYHNGLATVYFQNKRYAKAIATLKTAEPLADNDRYKFSVYSMRGLSYAALEKWADAVEDLEKARKLNGQKGSILVTLGQAYYKLGYFDKAAPIFREATKLVPNDATTLMLLAESLINLGAESESESQKLKYYREAMQVAEQEQRLKPESFEAHNLVGRAALGAQDYDKAEQAFRKVLAQKSDYCWAMVNLGKTYIAKERWAQAESILGDAADCAPRMAVVYESLGFAIQKQGRLEEAIAQYEKAQQIKPTEAVAKAIETARTNLEVARHNEEVAKLEEEQRLAEQAAEEAYKEELRKREEWKKKTERDD